MKGITSRIQQTSSQTVARPEIVDLVGSGNLTDETLNYGIDRDAGRLKNIDLSKLALTVQISEDPIPCSAREDGRVRLYFLPVPVCFVIRIEKEFVPDNAPAERCAELVLIQKRLWDSILIVEPG